MSANRTELGNILREAMTKNPPEEAEVNPEVAESEPVEAESVETDEVKTEETETVETTEEVEAVETTEEIVTIADFAKATEVEPSFVYNLRPGMPEGEEDLTVGELKDKYIALKNGSSVQSDALASDRAEFETYKSEQTKHIQQQMSLPQEILAAQAKVLAIKSQFETFDWATLEKENPGEAALYKQNINQAYQEAQSEAQNAIGQFLQARETELEKNRTEQYSNMLKAIPEWSTDSVRVTEQGELRPMLQDYGYSVAEIDGISDHRAMRMARDLMKLKAQTVKAKETLKKVVAVPKKYKSGNAPEQTKMSKQTVRLDKAAKALSPRDKAKEIGKLFRGE